MIAVMKQHVSYESSCIAKVSPGRGAGQDHMHCFSACDIWLQLHLYASPSLSLSLSPSLSLSLSLLPYLTITLCSGL